MGKPKIKTKEKLPSIVNRKVREYSSIQTVQRDAFVGTIKDLNMLCVNFD